MYLFCIFNKLNGCKKKVLDDFGSPVFKEIRENVHSLLSVTNKIKC